MSKKWFLSSTFCICLDVPIINVKKGSLYFKLKRNLIQLIKLPLQDVYIPSVKEVRDVIDCVHKLSIQCNSMMKILPFTSRFYYYSSFHRNNEWWKFIYLFSMKFYLHIPSDTGATKPPYQELFFQGSFVKYETLKITVVVPENCF